MPPSQRKSCSSLIMSRSTSMLQGEGRTSVLYEEASPGRFSSRSDSSEQRLNAVKCEARMMDKYQ
eukprot:IDg20897t1